MSRNDDVNPNLLPDEKPWIEEVSENFNHFIGRWIRDHRKGILTREDVLNVIRKVAYFRGNKNLLEGMTKSFNL